PAMLRPTCTFVIAGHSERRAIFAEDDELIGRKVKAIMEHGMTPILCVGESLAQREAGQAHQVVTRQLSAAIARIESAHFANLVVAYEPVWAIGTGIAALPADAAEMTAAIRETLRSLDPVGADQVRLIYGGSVTTESAPTLLGQENIDGALVGGASLSAVDFLAIAQAARR
ncbi:MAG: triose-phosphate isomerase, partial [Chloroflexia bacterium]|nr:triose-phosphate isomerase [Chloroflexia bacterium]